MRISRGCGCLLLLLAVGNLVWVIAAIVGLAGESVTVPMGVLLMFWFGANGVALLMFGVAGLRRTRIDVGGIGEGASTEEEAGDDSGEGGGEGDEE